MTNVQRGYVVGGGLLAATVALALCFLDLEGPPLLMPFLTAILAASYVGGLWPGVATTVVAAVIGILLVPPVGTLTIAHPNDIMRLVVFVLIGLSIAIVTGALHRARRLADERTAQSKRADERFMRAFVASPIAQAMSRLDDRTVTEVNPAYLKTFGLTREQIIGRKPVEAGLVIDDYQELSTRLRTQGYLDNAEVRVTGPDGRRVSLLMSCHMVEVDGHQLVLSSMIDVTERRAAEAQARQLAERFEQLAIAIRGQVFWLIDVRKRQILYVSPAYEEIWGRTCESLYADPQGWNAAIHAVDRERVNSAFAQPKTYCETYRVVQPSGAVRWISDKGFPIYDESGAVIRVAGVATDVTERRQLEDQVRQAQKLESVGRLAGGIAHDFNNLLSVIVANTDLLREEIADACHREMLDEVDGAVARAAALTRQLLAFSRKQPSEAIVLDVNRVVEDTRRMLRRLVGDDVQIHVSLDPEAGRIRCDPSQLVQVLMNLAVNARDAMSGRGGTVRIETRAEDAHVALAIIDDGCGMTPEVLARVFEPFFTTKEVGKGTGLGLAVVHGIVQQAGGTIDVQSVVGRGTTFTVRLPRVAEPVDIVVSSDASSSRGTERILLVDDDWHVRSSAARALRSRGYTVHEADCGRAALRVLDERPIDMLVTDVVMPGMDGRTLYEAAHRRLPRLPVLFMSGYTDDEVVHRGVRTAELAFLEKPFRVHALAAKVRQVLDESTS